LLSISPESDGQSKLTEIKWLTEKILIAMVQLAAARRHAQPTQFLEHRETSAKAHGVSRSFTTTKNK
jgi:hypothetical protein